MGSSFHWSLIRATLLALGVTTATISPIVVSAPTLAQTTVPSTTPTTDPNTTPGTTTPDTNTPSAAPAAANFSDVGTDYWSGPFIQALAARNVITGFPDQTFRPNQAVTRAEFAAMIQKAFNQNAVRQLSASGFRDVPANYWAASAIKEAYETGFMSGYPDNTFRPNEQIPKAQAITALSSGLNLTASNSGSASDILNTYYTDASAIPNYAVNSVAAATQANIVVNYPDVKQLNPQTPLTRAEAAALLYQALVRQGQAQPLAANLPASQYIVAAGTTGTTGNDIVSIAASNNSFSTLTTLIKAAGLAETLQQGGPYTVFAPTDQAFAALPAGTVQQLQQPENRELLRRILTYHVVPGQLTASQLTAGELKTVEEASVNIKVDSANNQIAVNDATVIQPNVQASNGVIHVINEVLIPPNLNVSQQPGETTPGGTTPAVDPGRSTRGGSSYVGVAGNIGLGGDSALSEGNIAVMSKIGLTRTISARPSAVFGDDPIVLIPVTFDFAPRSVDPTGNQRFPISPYIGAGVAIETSDDADIALLLTGGVDVPLGNRFTLNGAVNAAFLDETDVGLMLGVGYNF
ncbi:S-layer homology domain-containing protein [Nostoc sp. FACHB-152]|uniref:fasciclin domain-containing protein n=1 Tax=unclassified Nostoc TaxID=2593658 RepID=UPI0016849219|nr:MULTISPECIES: fasciclin domain-containing protein [unclassified Nostoc]MBD2448497.1 S-layer homology domain-containing protein [Nostoc sp. FACHB-152]MBD2466234.1 S-layer homology domain-containing protein [Nostoc sp. FACHB-145]